MALGNRFQLIDSQTFAGQTCLNVYYYRASAGATMNSVKLKDAFLNQVLPPVILAQSIDVLHNELLITNLDDDTDFLNWPLGSDNQGDRSGDALPPYACYSFLQSRASRAVRNGHKRYVGVAEQDQDMGIASGSILASLANIAAVLVGTISDGAGETFENRIVHKTVVHGIPTVYTDYGIVSAAYSRIGTQNTRKYGRGI